MFRELQVWVGWWLERTSVAVGPVAVPSARVTAVTIAVPVGSVAVAYRCAWAASLSVRLIAIAIVVGAVAVARLHFSWLPTSARLVALADARPGKGRYDALRTPGRLGRYSERLDTACLVARRVAASALKPARMTQRARSRLRSSATAVRGMLLAA